MSFFDSIKATLNATISSKRITIVRKSGSFWRHKWKSGVIWDVRRLSNPGAEFKVNWPLFTYSYKPKNGDIVLDLGAGIGTELVAFSKAVGPTGKVIAVDASKNCTDVMGLLVNDLKLNNVFIENAAIGNSIGYINFYSTGTELKGRISNKEGSTSVPVITIEHLLNKFQIEVADYCKMNIEGAEFISLKNFDSSRIRNYVISCHDFMGEKELETYQMVLDWAKSEKLSISKYDNASPGSCEDFYLYLSHQ